MIDVDTSIANVVRRTFEECFSRDMRDMRRFDRWDPKKYIAPFEVYREDYRAMEGLGVKIVDPNELGFSLGRDGGCVNFALYMLGLPFNIHVEEQLEGVLEFPTSSAPIEGCIALYKSILPEAPISEDDHIDIFRNGKVLSKWGPGPIFEHDLSSIPFVWSVSSNGREFPYRHWVEFFIPR